MRLPQTHSAGPRWIGRLRVLDALRQNGAVARIDLSRITGLSPATVTAITAELLEAALIEPAQQYLDDADAKRGRPRSSLRLNAEALMVAGIKVGTDSITVILCDFLGEPLSHYDYPLMHARFAPETLCQQIKDALSLACEGHDVVPEQLAGAAIGLAGYVDGAAGFVHWSSSLIDRSVHLGDLLNKSLPCPVFIENDVNLVAKAEQLFGRGKHYKSFLVVTLEHGIGLGIVIDGALHRGARGCGAELGHTKVAWDGAPCQCGQLGCLEAYAGEYALIAQASLSGSQTVSDFPSFLDALRRNDPGACAALEVAEQYFCMSLANLVNVFDPECIIIASKIGADHPLCGQKMLSQVENLVVRVDKPMPKIMVHGWGDLMWAKGAAAHALEEVSALRVQGLGQS